MDHGSWLLAPGWVEKWCKCKFGGKAMAAVGMEELRRQKTTSLATRRDIAHSIQTKILYDRTFRYLRVFHSRRLPPDERRGRFNFPGQTCLNPLVSSTLTRRTSATIMIRRERRNHCNALIEIPLAGDHYYNGGILPSTMGMAAHLCNWQNLPHPYLSSTVYTGSMGIEGTFSIQPTFIILNSWIGRVKN
uniref:Uncharacterized protein n=1 Tax=Vitis vinifera TaxID=29760 RepID=A5ARR0_VITVI|nr:hypothetical protein VITISV_006253 [Vitis vinifera]